MIKPIETAYKGYRFRSRLEARWAVFFDALNLPWEYEFEGYNVRGTNYLPDFWLPTASLSQSNLQGIWVEIKPEQFASHEELDESKYLALSERTRYPLLLLKGLPLLFFSDALIYHGPKDTIYNMQSFSCCHKKQCGSLTIELQGSHYPHCYKCNSPMDFLHPKINNAINKSRQARFEFGESG